MGPTALEEREGQRGFPEESISKHILEEQVEIGRRVFGAEGITCGNLQV